MFDSKWKIFRCCDEMKNKQKTKYENIVLLIKYLFAVFLLFACLVINSITVDNSAVLFDCTPVDRASDSMMPRPKAIHFSWLGPELFRLLLDPPGLN